jgi:glycosyltransferase involved in cell wall biosynthesis
VSVLEAMRAGLPAVVTSSTGSKSMIKEIGNEFVSEPSPMSIASSVTKYFELPTTDRQTLSSSVRKVGSNFDEQTRAMDFQNKFEDLVVNLLEE